MSSRQKKPADLAGGTRPPARGAERVAAREIPQHVAGLARAVDDYVTATRFGSDDVQMCKIALDGAVAAYYTIENLGDDGGSS